MAPKRKRARDGDQEEGLHQHGDQPEQEKLTPYELQRQRLCVSPAERHCGVVVLPKLHCIPFTLKSCTLREHHCQITSKGGPLGHPLCTWWSRPDLKSDCDRVMVNVCRIEQNRRRLIELGIPAAVAGLNSTVAQHKYIYSSCAALVKMQRGSAVLPRSNTHWPTVKQLEALLCCIDRIMCHSCDA